MAPNTLSAEQDLDVVWSEVVRRINEDTGLFGSDILTLDRLNIEDIVRNLTPPEDSKQAHKAKAVFKNVLLVIQQFGKVISDATSAVFEPSQQCINGINILITAIQKAGKLFDDAVVLMERVSVFLESLKIWFDKQNKLDIRLRRPIYHVLEHFIEIVALTHKLAKHSTKEWWKALGKGVFLGGDQRVINAIAMLETRVSDVTRIQVAVICKDLQGTARDVRELKGDMELMLQNESHHITVLQDVDVKVDQLVVSDDLRYIRDKIGEYATGVRWSKEFAALSYVKEGTGDWLFERDDFKRWQANGSVFLIKGDPQRGRGSLAYAIIKRIRPDAYHFLPRWAPQRSLGLEAALSIIWQLAVRDPALCHSFRQSDVDWNDKLDLWRKLIMPRPITIVLDNVDDLDPRWTFGKVLAGEHKLKLCLMGPLIHLEKQSAPSIILDGASLRAGPFFPNARDIALIIDDNLGSFMLEHRERVKTTLLEHIQNDMATLYPALDDIKRCSNQRQLNVVLKATADKAVNRIESMVEGLNRKLRQDEILQLNAILSWLAVAETSGYSLPLLYQYLSACGLKPRLGKFEFVLEVEGDHFGWRDRRIEEYLRSRSEFERLSQRKYRQALDPEEATLVNTLIRTHLTNVLGAEGKAIYERYGFDQFFREKMGVTTARIRLDEGESHVALLDACLDALTVDLHDAGNKEFRSYAAQHLHHHLRHSDVASADPQTCQNIAIKLMKSLSDEGSMLAFWRNRISLQNKLEPPIEVNDYEADYRQWLEWIDDIPGMHEAKTWYRTHDSRGIFLELTRVGVDSGVLSRDRLPKR